jgi:large subunit ribosomal protein L25
MATASLSATPRSATGKGAARSLRRDGQVPAVIYGHAREPQPLAINTRELERLLERISAASTVIDLSVDGRTARTLIREIQRHPFKRSIVHIDFQELVAGETVTVNVPLVVVGAAAGVREGGVLDQVMRELSIEVDPANMPNHIDVDVSELTIGHSIHVRDLRLPSGVTVLEDEDATVVVVSAPKAVAEETPAAAEGEGEASAEPEVIGRAKKDEEEGAEE